MTVAVPATWLQQAEVALAQRDLPVALALFYQAEAAGADPDACAAGRWMAYMLGGNFTAAWQESDAIRARGAPDAHRFWQGEDLRGKRVILRCLHGLGDTIQFLRYVPQLRELAAHLVVELPPRMMEIAPCFAGVDDVTTWGASQDSSRTWDVQIEIMELPYLFRTAAYELPLAQGYFHVPTEAVRIAGQTMGYSGLSRVGVVWAAGDWDSTRSLPCDLLRPLLDCAEVEFWSLQGGVAAQEWNLHAGGSRLRDAARCGQGLLALAATIAHLDLVITVDTLAAHLAGAMGKQTWLLLQHAADWRWMTEREDSPWYPTMRVFRQPVAGDWNAVIERVRTELAVWSAPRIRTRLAV